MYVSTLLLKNNFELKAQRTEQNTPAKEPKEKEESLKRKLQDVDESPAKKSNLNSLRLESSAASSPLVDDAASTSSANDEPKQTNSEIEKVTLLPNESEHSFLLDLNLNKKAENDETSKSDDNKGNDAEQLE